MKIRMNAAGLVIVACVTIACAACPSFVKKTVIEKEQSFLPEGWAAFAYLHGQNGLYISSLRVHDPRVVPGTENHRPRGVEISSDGNYLAYIDSISLKLFVIKREGGVPKEIPMKLEDGSPAKVFMGGFYHSSPLGTEVYGVVTAKHICAVGLTFTNNDISIGPQRFIMNFVDEADNSHTINAIPGIGIGVSGSHILSRHIFKVLPFWTTMDVTIPLGGKGTATINDMYKYSFIQSDEMISGCGHTISHDGEYCVFNPGNAGSLECVPQSGNDNSHRGFVVRKFLTVGSTAMSYDDQFDKYASSINWAPERFRNVSYSLVDFTQWSFSNDNRYLIGAQIGVSNRSPLLCLWVIEWETNTWYRITPDQNVKMPGNPALFIGTANSMRDNGAPRGTDPLFHGVHSAVTLYACAKARLDIPAGTRIVELYDVNGRCVWRFRVENDSVRRTISLPTRLVQTPLIVRMRSGAHAEQ
jgi:hypothetical protein